MPTRRGPTDAGCVARRGRPRRTGPLVIAGVVRGRPPGRRPPLRDRAACAPRPGCGCSSPCRRGRSRALTSAAVGRKPIVAVDIRCPTPTGADAGTASKAWGFEPGSGARALTRGRPRTREASTPVLARGRRRGSCLEGVRAWVRDRGCPRVRTRPAPVVCGAAGERRRRARAASFRRRDRRQAPLRGGVGRGARSDRERAGTFSNESEGPPFSVV